MTTPTDFMIDFYSDVVTELSEYAENPHATDEQEDVIRELWDYNLEDGIINKLVINDILKSTTSNKLAEALEELERYMIIKTHDKKTSEALAFEITLQYCLEEFKTECF